MKTFLAAAFAPAAAPAMTPGETARPLLTRPPRDGVMFDRSERGDRVDVDPHLTKLRVTGAPRSPRS